jgi:hypothetical protein
VKKLDITSLGLGRRALRTWVGAAAGAAAAAAISLGAVPAEAHLMAAKQGTVNVVGAAVYTVVSVPASALSGADDNHDGVLDTAELERHEAELRAEVDRRLVILDGGTPARTVRVDLILSPDHGAAGDRADQIVVLKHAELDAPPADLRVRCDLFGARTSEQSLTITATRHPASGAESEVAVLAPGAAEHAFFPPAPRATTAAVGEGGRGPGGLPVLGVIFGVAAAMASRARARRGARAARAAT